MRFDGARVRLARTFHDLTLQELGAAIASSPAVLSNIENGRKEPKDDLLDALAKRLGFEPEFFFQPILDEFTEDECSFRRRTTTPEREKKRVLAHGTLFGELVRYLNAAVALPTFSVPHLPPASLTEVENIAHRCRLHWDLGVDAPIAQVGRVLERAGVVLTSFEAETLKVDAFSRFGDVSVIVLNTTKGSSSRTLFDIAHEAGHLVMHRGVRPNTPEREAEADYFASAFLLPRLGFARDFRAMRRVDWPHLIELKRHWRVSVAAMIRRAYDLGLIDAIEYRRLNASRMAKGYHKSEPAEPTPLAPEMVRMAFASLETKKGEPPFAVARKLHWTPTTLEAVAGIPVPPPQQDGAPVVSLDSFRSQRTAHS